MIAFVLRYLIIRKSENNFDVYGHLYFIRQIKEKGKGPFRSIETNILESEDLDNPFLWHWIAGFLPTEFTLRHNNLLNPLLDATYISIIYALSLMMGIQLSEASLIILLYLASPLFFTKLNIGPRLLFTPRLFSEVFVNLFFIVTLLPLGLSEGLKLTMGALCVFLVLGSSKFGLQALLFMTPMIAVFENSLVPLVSFCIGLLAILMLSGFSFAKSLRVQFSHLIWYFRKNLKGKTPVSKRNDLRRIFSFHGERTLLENLARLMIRLLQDFSYSSMFLKFPSLILFFILLIRCFDLGTYDSLGLCDGPVFSCSILFLLTSLPLLLFLGEAERYVSHLSYFVILGVVIMANSLNLKWILYCLIGYGLLYFLIEVCFLRDPRKARAAEDRKLLSFLRKQSSPTNLVIYPFHALSMWRVLLETKAKVLYPFHLKKEVKGVVNQRYCPEYPYTNLVHLDEMAAELGINMLVVDKKELSRKLPGWRIGENWQELDLGGKFHSVFSRKDFEVIL